LNFLGWLDLGFFVADLCSPSKSRLGSQACSPKDRRAPPVWYWLSEDNLGPPGGFVSFSRWAFGPSLVAVGFGAFCVGGRSDRFVVEMEVHQSFPLPQLVQ
jgi:hypothetical protein